METFKMPSISKWPRVMKCAASAVLPQLEGEQTEAASVGTIVHRFIEQAAGLGRDAALGNLPADQPQAIRFCEALRLEDLPASGVEFAHELAVRYWPGSDAADLWDRDAPRDPNAIHGILDVVGVSKDAVYVGDFKTGWGSIEPPATNWQMRVGALAAARLFKRTRALVALIHLRDDGESFQQQGQFDDIDLDVIADELAVRVGLLWHLSSHETVPTQEIREGSHCRYCPAFRSCPAKVSMINAVIQAPSATIDTIRANLTVANAASAYARYKQLKAVVDEIGKAIYGFAAEHPIPTENGMVLKMTHTDRESVDGEVVYKLMRELYGEAAADQAVERSSSKTAIEDVFRTLPREKGETIKARKEAFLERLRADGGIEVKGSDSVKEVKA